jgi:hypothetical protein
VDSLQHNRKADAYELVTNAKLYFDKPVRVVVKYEMATEGRYLSADKCPLNHDDQIGAGAGMLDEAAFPKLRGLKNNAGAQRILFTVFPTKSGR